LYRLPLHEHTATGWGVLVGSGAGVDVGIDWGVNDAVTAGVFVGAGVGGKLSGLTVGMGTSDTVETKAAATQATAPLLGLT
jgi:hypothetical protein